MLIRSINLEAHARKGYKELRDREKKFNKFDSDVYYMGGQKDDNQKEDICSKLFGSKPEVYIDPDEQWDKMTKVEKEERVEWLWKQARKYNNQLRFKARLAKMSEKNMHLDATNPAAVQ